MSKIKSGICIYSLTPPKADISEEKLTTINKRRIDRLSKLNCDVISIYDVQVENTRTSIDRTYEYKPSLNPLKYGESISLFTDLPQIIYLASGKYSVNELHRIFSENPDKSFVLVGSPGRDVPVKSTLTEAYKVSSNYNNEVGGVLIGERHQDGKSEVRRILKKSKLGSKFFVSQCIYDFSLYERFLNDYLKESKRVNEEMKPLILTFSPVGNKKDLDFMKWLGVKVPEDFETGIVNKDNFLTYTIEYLEQVAGKLIDLCNRNRIPFGINFESVIGKKAEILASIDLAKRVSEYMNMD